MWQLGDSTRLAFAKGVPCGTLAAFVCFAGFYAIPAVRWDAIVMHAGVVVLIALGSSFWMCRSFAVSPAVFALAFASPFVGLLLMSGSAMYLVYFAALMALAFAFSLCGALAGQATRPAPCPPGDPHMPNAPADWHRHAGASHGGGPAASANDRIDLDLARQYGDAHDQRGAPAGRAGD